MILPVLLSGGTGTRLWPLSRETYPKQFLRVGDELTLLQRTASRVADPERFLPPLVVANAEHRFIVAEQLRAAGLPWSRIVLEPFGRSTAPAAAIAALLACRDDPDGLILLMPADHVVRDEAAFRASVEAGAEAARQGLFVLFGITPTEPATGYGYIRRGEPAGGAPGAYRVRQFVEKPDLATATAYVRSGEYLWNGGIFLLPAAAFLDELAQFEPDMVRACRAALAEANDDLDFLRLDAAAFADATSISVDHAVMERTTRAAVVPAGFDWSDIGAWSALWELNGKDGSGNVAVGDVMTEDTEGCYIHTDGQLVATLGVRDLVVVTTPDAVLVASKSRDQDIKLIVDRLKAAGHEAATQAKRVHRPWGCYQSLHQGDQFQVKRITVNPGEKLSLQKHFHRSEHWVVVNGTALVTRDDEQILLRENESTFLPLGCVHRLENPGRVPLEVIEVQSGSYLGEDDIVRLEDAYARS